MTDAIDIKAASSPEDIAVIEALAREIWTQHYTPLIGAEQVAYMLNNFQSGAAIGADIHNGYIYFVAYLRGEPCGYSAMRHDPDALFLSKLYVRESCRGKGIARAMLKEAEQAARQHGSTHIRLTCNKHNSGSLGAYARMGFARTSAVVTDIGGGFVMDDYVMEKRL